MSWLGFWNYYFCQWLFFRIYVSFDDQDPMETPRGGGIYFPVVPLTGWRSSYRPKTPRRWHLWGRYV